MLLETKTFTKNIFLICLVILSLILLIFVTYSMRQGNFSRSILTSTLMIDEEAYGNTKFNSNKLNLVPIIDKNINNQNSIHIEFNVGGSIENNTDEIIYNIALVDLELDCELLSPYLKWKLIKNNKEEYTGTLDYKFDTIVDKRLVLTDIEQDLVPYNEDKTKYDHYDFYLWISDSCQEENTILCKNELDQSNLLNKRLKGKIEVELYGGKKQGLQRKPSDELDVNTCIKKGSE